MLSDAWFSYYVFNANDWSYINYSGLQFVCIVGIDNNTQRIQHLADPREGYTPQVWKAGSEVEMHPNDTLLMSSQCRTLTSTIRRCQDGDAQLHTSFEICIYPKSRIHRKKGLTLLKSSLGHPAKGHRDMMMDHTEMRSKDMEFEFTFSDRHTCHERGLVGSSGDCKNPRLLAVGTNGVFPSFVLDGNDGAKLRGGVLNKLWNRNDIDGEMEGGLGGRKKTYGDITFGRVGPCRSLAKVIDVQGASSSWWCNDGYRGGLGNEPRSSD